MIAPSENDSIKKKVTVIDAAKILNVSIDTIRRWDKKKLIRAERDSANCRVFNIDELIRFQRKSQPNEKNKGFYVLRSEATDFSVIELFSGCGGLALGLENAGLKSRLLVEYDKDAVATLKENRSKWNVVHDDIRNVKYEAFAGKIDVVAGGFPCQAFSYAGNGKGFEDTRGTLFFEFARAIKDIRPKILLAENVRGLVEHDGGKTLQTMIRVLGELGYNIAYKLVRAQFLDVAQKRERLLILGVRKDLKIAPLFPKERDYTVTLRQALKDCPTAPFPAYSKKKYELMRQIPEGGYWRDLPADLQKSYLGASYHSTGGRTGMARRMSWDEPSLTLTCNPAQKQTERCHPIETRPFTVREYARIQSFPDDWKFIGSVTSQYRQIGNAVPVNVGYHIGRCIVGMLSGKYDKAQVETAQFCCAFSQPNLF